MGSIISRCGDFHLVADADENSQFLMRMGRARERTRRTRGRIRGE